MSIRLGFRVPFEIDNAHPKLPKYKLLEGDILTRQEDGTFMKECPGVAVGGFVLSDEEIDALEDVKFENVGLAYRVIRG